MKRLVVLLLLVLSLFATTTVAISQQVEIDWKIAKPFKPGAERYTPTRIEWLTTVLQASLRADKIQEEGFVLVITSPDSETILIYVRYVPEVNRQVMNIGIEAAREVIKITAKSYGWDKWLKVKEDIRMAK